MKLQKYNFPDTGNYSIFFNQFLSGVPSIIVDCIYNSRKKRLINETMFSFKLFTVSFAVVWNPWSDQAREIGDLGDDEYPNMLCVEAGHVSTPVILLPGTAFEASQILQVNVLSNLLSWS